MNTGEDEPSSGLNGRLRPRKSNATLPSSTGRSSRKTDNKLIQDKQRRNVTPSKTLQNKTDDIVTPQPPPDPHLLCPYCERKFATKLSASKHARRIHLSVSKQDHFINCLYCNHSDAEPHDIIRHMVDSHPNQYFACLDCHTRFPSTTELAEHKLNVCEKQKAPYRSKLRQKNSIDSKKNNKRLSVDQKGNFSNENKGFTDDNAFSGMVISCELKPSQGHDAADIEDNITTNLILPPGKTLGNTSLDKNAVMVLDDLQWNKRISTPNFTFHNTDADQILSRLGVVHRSPRVGESTRRAWLKMLDENNQKFEKCFDTNFYSKVASNVQENLSRFLDGSFNFNPDADSSIKTRKSKCSVVINTAEGFPILLAYEQFTRHILDGYMPRPVAPRHKWKWGNGSENEENALVDPNAIKRDSHVNNCIITLVSSLDIWTQLRMRRKFEDVFSTTSSEKTEKNNIIALELKEILESRELPTPSSQVVKYTGAPPPPPRERSEWASYLGLSPVKTKCEEKPAVLSGEWVRPRCYICCACGEQTRDGRGLTLHMSTQHPYAQVQHYEIVGDTLLNSDIIKHLYVPPSQLSNRTRPPRGFRDCTKCKKSIALEDMHQHMLDCAGDTPAVRRKVRYRPFGVRRRRSRLPDNTIRKKIRKEIRSRRRQKVHMRPRPKVRTEVGDAETIRKMIADLPAKRARVVINNSLNNIRSKKVVDKKRTNLKINRHNTEVSKNRITRSKKSNVDDKDCDKQKKPPDTTQSDDDDAPLKLNTKSFNDKKSQDIGIVSTKTSSTLRSQRTHKTNSDTNNSRFLNKSNTLSSSNKRVNVKTSGVRLRERGTRSERNDKRQSKSGGTSDRAGASKDSENNITPGPNVPLKHSIARLTADNDTGVKTPQQLGLDTTEQKQVVTECAPTDKQQLFENDTKKDKLDKPPLSQNIAKTSENVGVQKSKSNKPRKRLTDCIAMLAKKVGEPGQELKEVPAVSLEVTCESDKTPSKSNEIHKMDRRDETLAKYHESLRNRAKVALSHETILDLAKRNETQPNRECESTLRASTFFEQSTLHMAPSLENSDSPNDPDPPVIISRHMAGPSNTETSYVGIISPEAGSRTLTSSELIDSRSQWKSIEESMAEVISQRRSSNYDSNFVQPPAKQIDAGRRKSSQQSASRSEIESHVQQMYNPNNLPNFPFYPMSDLHTEASPSNMRRKSYDCTPTSSTLNQYYHSQLNQRQNFLSVPMFVRPDLRNLPLEGIDKNLALQLLSYSRNPTDMTAFADSASSDLSHLVNWEGQPRSLYTSPSPDSRHLRHDSIQRETVALMDINMDNPQNYHLVHRTTPVKTPDGRICVTPIQHDPHRPSPEINHSQQVNNNYMRSITTPELNSMNPPSSVGVRRESCKRVLDTSEKGLHSQEFSDENSHNKVKRSPDNILNAHAVYAGSSELAAAAYHHPRDKVSVSPLSQDSIDYKKAAPEYFYTHVPGKFNDSFNTSTSTETSFYESQKRGHNEVLYPGRTSREFDRNVRQANVYDERLKSSKEQNSNTTMTSCHRDRFRSPVAKNLPRSQQELLNLSIPKENSLYPESSAEQIQKNQSLLDVAHHHYNIPSAPSTTDTDASKHSFLVDQSDPRLLDNYNDELPLNMVRNCPEIDQTLSTDSGQMPLDLSTKGPDDEKDKVENDDGPEDMSIKTRDQEKKELRVKNMTQLSHPEFERARETIGREYRYANISNALINICHVLDYNQSTPNEELDENFDKLEPRDHGPDVYIHDKLTYSQYVDRDLINEKITTSSISMSKSIPTITVNSWEREEMTPEVTVASDDKKLGSQLTDMVTTGVSPGNLPFQELESQNTMSSASTHIALQTDDYKSVEPSPPQKNTATDISNVPHDANETLNPEIEDKRKNLPKEIIDLIGDLPKGNLDKLLDILPQYVCASNSEKNGNESVPKENPNTNTTMATPVVNTTINTTDETLTVNTNLLSAPSSILPKKRHSPKHSYAQQYHQKYSEEKVPVTPSPTMQDVKPNIIDSYSEAMTKKIETVISTGNPQIKVIDLTKHDDKLSSVANEIISMEKSSALPLGLDLTKPAKTKTSSDKTAILRAVRFKKSSSDAPPQPTLQEGNQNVNKGVLKHEYTNVVPNSTVAKVETDNKAEMLHNEKGTTEQSSISDTIEQLLETIPPEINKEENVFLELSSKNGAKENKVSASEICVSSNTPSCVLEKKDSINEPLILEFSKNSDSKISSVELQDDISTSNPLTVDWVRSTSQEAKHVSSDSVLEPKSIPISNDEINNGIESSAQPLIIESSEIQKPCSANEILSDNKNFDDDSDDDVSLAFIVRQKQLDQSVLTSADLSRPKAKTKQKAVVKQIKQKKTKKKKTKSLTSKKLSEVKIEKTVSDNDGEQNSKNISDEPTEMSNCNNDLKSLTQLNAEIQTKTIEPLDESDVNKENDLHDHLIKIKDCDKGDNSDQRALNEKNSVEEKVDVDNEIDKTLKEIKEIKDSIETGVEDSTSKNKGKKRKKEKGMNNNNNNKTEDTETLVKCNTELDTPTIALVEETVQLNLLEENINCQVEEQNSCVQSNIDLGDRTNARKCRTIQKKKNTPVQVNYSEFLSLTPTTIPLRRSRRGKSFYAETNDSVNEIESTFQSAEKLPLTKKQLIFSKLLQDENETIGSVSDQEKEDSNVSVTSTDKNKIKSVKRKKSPQGRRNIKKNKSLESQNDKEFCDTIIAPRINVEENLIDVCLKDITTEVCIDQQPTDQHDNSLIEDNNTTDQPSTTEKRKSDSTDISTLPKKTKLTVETDEISNQEINATEYDSEKLKANDDDVNIDTGERVGEDEVDLNKSPIYKQDDNVLKTQHKDNTNSVYRKHNESGSLPETRTACYNRQIEYRQSRSSVVLDRNSEHYDPYDIDLDDMIEIAQPIIKNKKGKHSKSSPKGSKRAKRKSPVHIDYDSSSSDSDSSKSDVPLQKYFEEKRMLEHKQSKDNKENMIAVRKDSPEHQTVETKTHKQDYIEDKIKSTEISDEITIPVKDVEPDTIINNDVNDKSMSSRSNITNEETHQTNIISEKGNLVETEIDLKPKDIQNVTSPIPSTTEKPVREKKHRKSLNTQNIDTDISENKQPSTDKFLENFGFYSERKPRKSNLLASKKIAETIHMINDSDDAYFNFKDRVNKRLTQNRESKKSLDAETSVKSSQDPVKFNIDLGQCKVLPEEIKDTETNHQSDAEMDPIMAQTILNSEEIRSLENDLIEGFRKAAEENANQPTHNDCLGVENNLPNEVTRDLTSPEDLEPTSTETKKGKNKTPKIRPPGYKEMMYPEINIDEIDLFEDKFDKIKRKCRSQAAAAKQTSVVESSSLCDKSRKKPEKKIKKKCAKKNIQSTNVPTKAALKGFDGIKISILTQDLNMPLSVTPPRPQKKRKGGNGKKKKERKDSDSSSKYDSDPNTSSRAQEKDIYEFKDNDDTELLELRPSTVMDRFRSLNKEQSKQKDKCKDKESQKHSKSSRPGEFSNEHDPEDRVNVLIDDDKSLVDYELKNKTDRRKTTSSKFEAHLLEDQTSVDDNKYISDSNKPDPDLINIQAQSKKRKSAKGNVKNEDDATKNMANDKNVTGEREKGAPAMIDDFDDDSFEGTDNIPLASTARFVPPTNDDSSFEWNSSPESGYVYMSENMECNCTPESEFETGKKGCDSLACLHLKNNAEKKAVMGKIFKNNAVRENNEPLESPKDMDQLFDSLLESNSNDASLEQNDSRKNKRDISPVPGPSTTNYVRYDNNSLLQVSPRELTSPATSHVLPQAHATGDKDKSRDEMELDAFSRLLNTPSTSAAANAYVPRLLPLPPAKIDDDSISNNDDLYRQCILSHNEDDTNDSFIDQSNNESPVDEYVLMSSKNTQTEDPNTIVEAPKPKPIGDDDESDLDDIESNDFIVLRRYVVMDSNGSQTDLPNSDPTYTSDDEEKSVVVKNFDDDAIGATPQPSDYTTMSTKCTQTNSKKHKSKSKHSDDQSDDDSNTVDVSLPKDKITLKKIVATTIKSTQTEHKSRKSSKYDESPSTKFVEPFTSKDKRSKAKPSRKSHKTEIKDYNGTASEGETSAREEDGQEISLRLDDSFIVQQSASTKSEDGTSHTYVSNAEDLFEEDAGVARQRARRKCTVGKQNVLAEHWSSESEVEAFPARPSSANSVVGARKKKGRKREGQQASASGKRARLARKEGEVTGRAPPGPTIRARPALMPPYWSSDTEDTISGMQPQHGWIVGNSHKKVVTLLANAKGRKRNDDKRNLDE